MRKYLLQLLLILACTQVTCQGFLHAEGKQIVDGAGENFLIKSIGTGNWMIMEGYMMESSGVAGTHTDFRERLLDNMGVAKTDSFYTAWLNSHFTGSDADSMAKWGFNAVRVALHYKWFTLPIEDEPVEGEQTWIGTGFSLVDSLVKWCGRNQMYVILDMHGAPGGQGGNSSISDYDPDKPSLWESEDNKVKLIELWGKIAERYSDEQWIGGYDLINEPNWDLPGGTALREIYERITEKIREVDQNHIIFIEGNWYANTFTGLTPPDWDDNLAYSFHKYWSSNTSGSLEYGTWLRDQYNVPVWLGETGENSNNWFTSLVERCEEENLGWSFWPVKKGATSNVMRVEFNEEYYQLLNSWSGDQVPKTPEAAFKAVMELAGRHQAENCIVQYDVIDAMIRQPFTDELKPFRMHEIGQEVFATDYALGKNGFAYFDEEYENSSGTAGGASWNNGGGYRNDGVDIERCEDTDTTNGYNVGWTNGGEWMVYHIRTDSAMLVDGEIRSAASSSGGKVSFDADGEVASGLISLPVTGGWQNWSTTEFKDVRLPAGEVEVKLRIFKDGSNINYFRFKNPRSISEDSFRPLLAETSVEGNTVFIHLNRTVSQGSLSTGELSMKINNQDVSILDASVEPGENIIEILPGMIMPNNASMTVGYSGAGIESEGEILPAFDNLPVASNLFYFPTVPARIQAEDFFINSGYEIEACEDSGGGSNTGYADPGDFLDYIINVPDTAEFKINMRVAKQGGSSTVGFLRQSGSSFTPVQNMVITSTGGWQTWETQTTNMILPQGKYRFRIKCVNGAFNLNWFEIRNYASSVPVEVFPSPKFFPNPADEVLYIEFPPDRISDGILRLIDLSGRTVLERHVLSGSLHIDITALPPGVYVALLSGTYGFTREKIIVQ